jgi:hypothetical protein
MFQTTYQKIRDKVEKELESVSAKGTRSDVRLLSTQYVSGVIDTVEIIDPNCSKSLRDIKKTYIDAWAME